MIKIKDDDDDVDDEKDDGERATEETLISNCFRVVHYGHLN